MGDAKKRKSKSFYKMMAKNAKYDSREQVQLFSGFRGFLITCNFNEYNCLKDSYSILNDVADKLYGPNYSTVNSANNDDKNDEDNNIDKNSDNVEDNVKEENIEASIEAELAALKSTKERRFHQVKTKCQNVIFVKTNDTKVIPSAVVTQLFTDIESSRTLNSRYLQRILPVDITFKANKEVFFERFGTLFDQLAPKIEGEKTKFSVLTKVRFNNDHPSESALKEACIKIIKEKRSNWIVRHDNPEVLVAVNICTKAACLSILENYDRFSKYNPGEYLKKLQKDESKDNEEENKKEMNKEEEKKEAEKKEESTKEETNDECKMKESKDEVNKEAENDVKVNEEKEKEEEEESKIVPGNEGLVETEAIA